MRALPEPPREWQNRVGHVDMRFPSQSAQRSEDRHAEWIRVDPFDASVLSPVLSTDARKPKTVAR